MLYDRPVLERDNRYVLVQLKFHIQYTEHRFYSAKMQSQVQRKKTQTNDCEVAAKHLTLNEDATESSNKALYHFGQSYAV